MKAALLGFLAISICLSAQPVSGRDASPAAQDLKGDLQSLRAGARSTPEFIHQLSGHVLLLMDKAHQPKAPSVEQFAQSLATALSGHSFSQNDIDGLAADMERALRAPGASLSAFEQTVKDFERRLMRAGVPPARARLVASSLERLAKEVRGPEDTPAAR